MIWYKMTHLFISHLCTLAVDSGFRVWPFLPSSPAAAPVQATVASHLDCCSSPLTGIFAFTRTSLQSVFNTVPRRIILKHEISCYFSVQNSLIASDFIQSKKILMIIMPFRICPLTTSPVSALMLPYSTQLQWTVDYCFSDIPTCPTSAIALALSSAW